MLAAHQLSRNGEGDLESASAAVDDLWPDHAAAALAVLKTLREPTGSMAAAGDGAVWERMIQAALGDEGEL